MATLGRAFVEVRADTDKFPDDVRRAMRRLAQDSRQDTDRAGNLMGQRLATRMRHALNERMRRRGFNVEIEAELDSSSVAATEVALRRVTRTREVDIRVNRRQLAANLGAAGRAIGTFVVATIRILGDFFNFGRQIGQVLGEAFNNLSRAMGGAGSAAVSVGAAMAQLVATFTALAAVMVIMVGIFGVILAAASALYQALLLIIAVVPGLGVAFLLALGPIALIFTNLGDAIKATAGTVEEFEEAMEGLGRHTQGFFGNLRDAVQFFLGIREQVQEAFFRPINEALNDLQVNLGPTFQEGFIRVAGAAGRFADAFIALFDHPNTQSFFEDLFGLASLGFEEIGGAAVELTAAFANLIDKLMPETQAAVVGIGDTIRGWADGINDFANDPALDQKLETWKESFNIVVELIGTAVELAQALFNGFQEDGVRVLESVNGHMEQFIGYLESGRGEEFFDGLRVAAEVFLFLLTSTLGVIITMVELLGVIEDLLSGNINEAINDIVNNPLALMVSLLVVILDRVLQIRGGWERVFALLGVISLPLAVLRNLAGGLRDIVSGIRNFFENVRRTVGDLVGRFQAAAGAIQPVAAAARLVSAALSAAVGFARTLRDIAGSIRFPSIPSIPSGLSGLIPFLQEGGIFTRPTTAVIGEAGAEVVIPLTRPQRALELVQESGLLNLIRGGDGASAGDITVSPEVRVFIGDQELKGLVRVEVSNSNRQLKTRQLARTGSNK